MARTMTARFELSSELKTTTDLSSSLSILLVGTVGSVLLVSVSTVLLYFQTQRAYREAKAKFLIIYSSLVLGLVEGILSMYNQVREFCWIFTLPDQHLLTQRIE